MVTRCANVFILAVLMALAVKPSAAETRRMPRPLSPSQLAKLSKEQLRQRRISVAQFHPLRIHDDKLYDLTEVIIGVSYGDLPVHSGEYWVEGTVAWVGKDGVAVRRGTTGLGDLVFLRGHPAESKAVDGAWISGAMIKAGRYQYTTAIGGRNTVSRFEYGQPFAGSGKTFKTVIKISADGHHQTVEPFEP